MNTLEVKDPGECLIYPFLLPELLEHKIIVILIVHLVKFDSAIQPASVNLTGVPLQRLRGLRILQEADVNIIKVLLPY